MAAFVISDPPMTTLRAHPSAAAPLVMTAAGLLLLMLATYVLFEWTLQSVSTIASGPLGSALLLGSLAAGATTVGAVAALGMQRISASAADGLLGFGAGVMLAATAFSLVLPALDAALAQGATRLIAATLVGVGILLGGAVVHWLDRTLPHEHFVKGPEGTTAGRRARRVWLFIGAIAIHNIPEGLAIGVGAAGLGADEASALALGIAIQDIPEGLVPVVALIALGYRLPVAVLIGAATGLLEPLAALAAATLVGLSATTLPLALGMAGGAMLYVVSHEIIPASHRNDRGGQATAGLLAGFVLMMILDTALGK